MTTSTATLHEEKKGEKVVSKRTGRIELGTYKHGRGGGRGGGGGVVHALACVSPSSSYLHIFIRK